MADEVPFGVIENQPEAIYERLISRALMSVKGRDSAMICIRWNYCLIWQSKDC
jgi:hypothetical protein